MHLVLTDYDCGTHVISLAEDRAECHVCGTYSTHLGLMCISICKPPQKDALADIVIWNPRGSIQNCAYSLTHAVHKQHVKPFLGTQRLRLPPTTAFSTDLGTMTDPCGSFGISSDVVLSDIHQLSSSGSYKSVRTSLPGELRLAPHTPSSPGKHVF